VSFHSIFNENDLKTAQLVWNKSDSMDQPFYFLKSILRNSPEITNKTESILTDNDINEISTAGNVHVFYIAEDGIHYKNNTGSITAVILASVDGVPGWISEKGNYGVKLPVKALPQTLNTLLAA
jgi:hypothetical protein